MFYAYFHCKPDGTPFYVGKGGDRRVSTIQRRNKHHTSIVSKYGARNIRIVKIQCETEDLAFSVEKNLIEDFRNLGLRLANVTDGGEGSVGWRPGPETRALHSLKTSGQKNPFYGKKHSAEHLAKDSERAKQQMADPVQMDYLKQRCSMANAGPKNGFFGKRHSQATKDKISETKRLNRELNKALT